MSPLIGSSRNVPDACPARVRRACAEPGKARSHCGWAEGEAFAGSWKARETLLPAGASRAGGRGGAPLLGSALFSAPVPGFHAAFQHGRQPRLGQRAHSFPHLRLCDSSRLRPRDVASRSPPGIPHSPFGFRFQPPAGLSPLPSGRASSRGAPASLGQRGDYISQRPERPAPWPRSRDWVA